MLDEAIQENCGLMGIWGDKNVVSDVSLGLHMEQHRGQDHWGIVSGSRRQLYRQHGAGTVIAGLTKEKAATLKGNSAIAHTRYRTQGNASEENAQPLLFRHDEDFAVAHNGEFANQSPERKKLTAQGVLFRTDSDTEIVAHRIARSKKRTMTDKIQDALTPLKDSYSLLFLTTKALYGVRSPQGVRPLVIGELPNGALALASETVSFDLLRAKYIGEVNPGEMVRIDNSGLQRRQIFEPLDRLACIFEHIYFARPDSFSFGANVTNSIIRQWWGRQLWRENPVDDCVITPMPDSSNDSALGYFLEGIEQGAKIRFGFGFTRSHYTGRSFIYPTQALIEHALDLKINPNRSVIENQKVVIVEDSVVRGNTVKKTVQRAKSQFNAKEVHLRIASPPIRDICYLGINMKTKRELVFNRYDSLRELEHYVGADSLRYLSIEGMLANPYLNGTYCKQCFDGIRKISRR